MSLGALPGYWDERFTNETLVFQRPFSLGNAPETYPAGSYQIESKLQSIENNGHTAWVRTSTVLVVATATGSFSREVQGSDLDAAIRLDAEQGRTSGLSENPDRGDADAAGSPR